MDRRTVTAPDPLLAGFPVVNSLRSALRDGEQGLSTVPGLLKRVILEDLWQQFVTMSGERVEHDSFTTFVTLPPMRGLGADVPLLRRIVADDAEAVDLLDRVLQQPPGNRSGRNQHSPKVGTLDNIQGSKAPTGTSESAALRRLRKDRPDLHAQVLDGELSAHAAAVQAGFRPKTFTVRADNPESIVTTLRRQLDSKTLSLVIKLLGSEAE